jgi:ubiquinone/menaquinone biosynthesis C-methylase UbiE
MAETLFADPLLASVYDIANPRMAYEDFYLDLAGETPLAILDMGCGTGRLAVDLASRGHRVTGADPASGMLDVARKRPGSGQVTWIESDAAGLNISTRFDLIIMTGHAFQILQADAEILAALVNLRRHLGEGGRLAFETRNWNAREWDEWTPEKTREALEVPGIGRVEIHNSIASDIPPFVTYLTHFRFPGQAPRTEAATLRFVTEPELKMFLQQAGFRDITIFGDWDRSPVSVGSPEIIVIAR